MCVCIGILVRDGVCLLMDVIFFNRACMYGVDVNFESSSDIDGMMKRGEKHHPVRVPSSRGYPIDRPTAMSARSGNYYALHADVTTNLNRLAGTVVYC